MKKIITKGLIVTSLILGSTSLLANADFNFAETKKNIESTLLFQMQKIKVNKIYDYENFYMVTAEKDGKPLGVPVGISKDYKYILPQVININNGTPVALPIDIERLKDKQNFSYGTGKKQYYIFTDPECPYCKKLEVKMEKYKDVGTFHYFMFPLTQIHKEAMAMSKYILAGKDDAEKASRLKSISAGSIDYKQAKYTAAENEKLDALVKASMDLGMEIGVSGTPTILNDKGERVSEADFTK